MKLLISVTHSWLQFQHVVSPPLFAPVQHMPLSAAFPNCCISHSSCFHSSLQGATHPYLQVTFSPLRATLCVFWVCCSYILALTFDLLTAIPPCPSSLMTSYTYSKSCRVTTDVPSYENPSLQISLSPAKCHFVDAQKCGFQVCCLSFFLYFYRISLLHALPCTMCCLYIYAHTSNHYIASKCKYLLL